MTLTINTAAGTSYIYNGTIRDTSSGSCGALGLVKTRSRNADPASCGNSYYTGPTTISGGTLVL